MHIDNTTLVFSSGRRIKGADFLGIGVDGHNFIGVGYDNEFHEASTLTPDERRELADAMITAWTVWRDQQEPT